jgi:hypothetical protein
VGLQDVQQSVQKDKHNMIALTQCTYGIQIPRPRK